MNQSDNTSSASSTSENSEGKQIEPMMRIAFVFLLILALLYTLHIAKSLLMPIVVALLFALLLSPFVEFAKRLRVPRLFSSLLVIAMLGGPFVLLSIELSAPFEKWMDKVPELSAQLTEELNELGESFSPEKKEVVVSAPAEVEKGFSLFGWFDKDEPVPVPATVEPNKESAIVEELKSGGVEVLGAVLGAAPAVLAQFALWLILVLFLLIFGPGLYANAIEHFAIAKDRERSTLIVGNVRRELSRYLVTVTFINAGLGIVTASVLWLLKVEDALLWGALVALLNYAPYVGPIIAMSMLAIAGAVQYGFVLACLLPATVFFFINLLEAQLITPTILGRHMRLNPLILIVWLVMWGWLWGPVGLLLAVPLLVCLKLIATQLGVLSNWVAVIETQT